MTRYDERQKNDKNRTKGWLIHISYFSVEIFLHDFSQSGKNASNDNFHVVLPQIKCLGGGLLANCGWRLTAQDESISHSKSSKDGWTPHSILKRFPFFSPFLQLLLSWDELCSEMCVGFIHPWGKVATWKPLWFKWEWMCIFLLLPSLHITALHKKIFSIWKDNIGFNVLIWCYITGLFCL